MSDGTSLSLEGKRVHDQGLPEFIRLVSELVRDGQPHLIATPNVDHVITLAEDDALYDAYESTTVLTLDGMPLVRLARRLGHGNAVRLSGADIMPALVEAAGNLGWRAVITGGRDETAELAAKRLSAGRETRDVVAVPFPRIESVDDERSHDVIDALRELRPDLVFLCLGSPKQETWFAQWRGSLPPAVYFGVGAAVDFAAGTQVRAPQWLQNAGFEWAWRLGAEPRRLWKRYLLRGPRFARHAIASLAHSKR